jgi:hypothetical protein
LDWPRIVFTSISLMCHGPMWDGVAVPLLDKREEARKNLV